MSKVAVYEGCPACTAGYGQLPAALNPQNIMQTLQGAVVGSGAGLVADLIASKLLKIDNPILKAAIVVGTPIGIAAFVQKQNPEMAKNIAIGGTAVGVYTLLKNMLSGTGFAGYDGYGVIAAEPEVSIEEENYGVLTAETEETPEEYGLLVAEEEPAYAGYGYGQEIYIED